MTTAYIYVISNKLNGKRYVGKSVDPKRRFGSHLKDSRRATPKTCIGCAIKAHGRESFELQIVSEHPTERDAYNAERSLIQSLGTTHKENGYNLCEGGVGVLRPTEETLHKLRVSHHRRIDMNHPDARPKLCEECGGIILPKQPLTPCRLRAHVKQMYCTSSCARTAFNKMGRNVTRSAETRKKISMSIAGVSRPKCQNRIPSSHPDALPRKCELCGSLFEAKHPLTPASVKCHQRKRWCSRPCALRAHNQSQRIRRG